MDFLNHIQRCAASLRKTAKLEPTKEVPSPTKSVQHRKSSLTKLIKSSAPLEKPVHLRKTSDAKSTKTDAWGSTIAQRKTSPSSSPKMEPLVIRQETCLDFPSHLYAITPDHLSRKPNPELVDEFGRMFTYALLREAKDPKKAFRIERFMELHRRATEYWLKKDMKARENWDAVFISPEAERRNVMLLREYDEKWKVGKIYGCSICL